MTDVRSVGSGSSGSGTSMLSIYLDQYGVLSANNSMTLPAIQNSNSRFNNTVQSLTTGDNVITIPSTAGGVVIVMPASNTNIISLNQGGTLQQLCTVGLTVFTYNNPPPASLTLTAGNAIPDVQFYWL